MIQPTKAVKIVTLDTGHMVLWNRDGEAYLTDGMNNVFLGGDFSQGDLSIAIEMLRQAGPQSLVQ